MNNSKALTSAFDVAANYIAFKDRTEKEVYNKLKEKGYCSQEIDDAIQKLLEYGYINDERYALSYIKSNIGQKGARRIVMELVQKGIDKDVVGEAVASLEIDECSAIEAIIEKRYRNCDFSNESETRKVYSYFARRGFKFENINRVVSYFRKK